MASKSPEAFRTISEVASEVDVPQHVLRFWETRFTQIKPLKRGGGRRYYRPEDVELLRGIRTLLYMDGLTIKGVQKIFREQGARFVTEAGRAAGAGRAAIRAAIAQAPTLPAAEAAREIESPEIDADGEEALSVLETALSRLLEAKDLLAQWHAYRPTAPAVRPRSV